MFTYTMAMLVLWVTTASITKYSHFECFSLLEGDSLIPPDPVPLCSRLPGFYEASA